MAARVPHRYEPGHQICFQGNPAFAVFCIQVGRVKLSRLGPDGDQHVIAIRAPGELLGHRAVLLEGLYRASAEAIEPSVVCAIPRATFLDLLQEATGLAMAMLVRLAADSLTTEERLMARAVERVRTRFARFLLQRIPAGARREKAPLVLRLDLKRQEIARLIDVTPATLSHTLQMLAERGVLSVHGREIRVLDRAALERIARFASVTDE